MARRKTTINPGFVGRRPSHWSQPPLTPAPPPADNTSSSDESIVEGEGKPEPVTIDVDEFDVREDDEYFEEGGGEVNEEEKCRDDEEENEEEEENENNGMNEQVRSKIIQLLRLGKSNTSYKEDGQLRKNLSPIQKSVGKPDSYSEDKREKF